MNFRTTFLLLLSVLLLGVVIVRVERRTRSTRERREAARRVLAFQPETVSFLGIESGDLRIHCAREQGTWWITQPLRARADAGAMDRILYGLNALARGEMITPRDLKARGLGPADYGLMPSPRRILLGDRNRRYVLRIGREAPLGDSVYVQEEGGKNIMAVTRELLDLIPASVSDLRDRAVVPGSPEQVQRLEIQSAEGFLQMRRTDRGRWLILQPAAARASSEAVQRLLDHLFMVRIAEFLGPGVLNSPAAGLEERGLKISALLTGGREVSLTVGAPADPEGKRFYVWGRPDETIGLVEAAQLEPLRITMNGLRDRKLTMLDARDINRIAIEQGEKKLEMRRTDGAWNLVEPRRWKADERRVSDFLLAWTAPVIENFLPPPGPGTAVESDRPGLVIRLARNPEPGEPATGGETETILHVHGEPHQGRRQVTIQPEGFRVEIPDRLLSGVTTDPFYFRDLQVLELETGAVTRISVLREGSTTTVVRLASDEFKSAEGLLSTGVCQSEVRWLLRTVADLRALRFLPGDAATNQDFGFEKRADRLILDLKGGAGLAKIIILGDPASSTTRYARIQGQEGVFELDLDTCEKLLPTLLNSEASEKELHDTRPVRGAPVTPAP